MATAEEVLTTLKSIDAGIKALLAHVGVGAKPQTASAPASVLTASDRDLGDKYGNPDIRMADPRDWSGESMKGRRMSECPPEYLDLCADRWDYFAERAAEVIATSDDADEVAKAQKNLKYNPKDAARARGWAARLRAGWTAPPEEPIAPPPGAGNQLDDSDIPF